ncbi:hypothetical protein DIPPA_16688 [Diplonema papillatum]|nr:hypothetical protein DIPPA_16688 [Diplonema papillatum]
MAFSAVRYGTVNPAASTDVTDWYELGRRIGHGCYADVFEGVERRFKAPSSLPAYFEDSVVRELAPEAAGDTPSYAIKRVKVEPSAKVEWRRAVLEVAALKALSHPNVIPLHQAFLSEDKVDMVLEMAPFTVKDLLMRQRLHLDAGKSIVRQVCYGVRHLHASGIAHRDIKAENVVVFPTAEPARPYIIKLIDFGFCHILGTHGDDTVIPVTPCGTLNAMSADLLEVIDPDLYARPSARPQKIMASIRRIKAWDVHSLGVLSCNVLCCITPFKGSTVSELLASVRRDPSFTLRGFPTFNRLPEGPQLLLLSALKPRDPQPVDAIMELTKVVEAFAFAEDPVPPLSDATRTQLDEFQAGDCTEPATALLRRLGYEAESPVEKELDFSPATGLRRLMVQEG